MFFLSCDYVEFHSFDDSVLCSFGYKECCTFHHEVYFVVLIMRSVYI